MENVVCDLDLRTHDLGSVISSLPDYRKYSCKFWCESLQRFKSSRIHKISVIVAR